MLNKFVNWCYNNPVVVIVIMAITTLGFATQLPKTVIDAAAEGMMIQGDPDHKFYTDTLDKFGTDNISVVYIRDKNIFTPEKLKAIEDIHYSIKSEPWVSKVDSLFSVTNFKGVDGTLHTNPLMDRVPETDEDALAIKADAIRNPVIVNNLISEDGEKAAITIYVENDQADPDFNSKVEDAIGVYIKKYEGMFDEIFNIGTPNTKATIARTLLGDQVKLVPLTVITIVVVLFLCMLCSGFSSGSIMPLVTAGISIIWTLGFMAWMGIPVNALTSIVPTLILVVGSTEDMHMLSEFVEGLRHKKGNKAKAVDYMATKCGTAFLLKSLTTFLGFLTICINDITMLKQFGMASAFALFTNPIITVMVVPVFLRIFTPGATKSQDVAEAKIGFVEKKINRFADLFVFLGGRYKWPVFTCIMIAGLAIFYNAQHIRVNNDQMAFFKESSDIRTRAQTMHENLSGSQLFYIRISSGKPGTFREPENLEEIYALQKFLSEKGWFDKTISLTDHLAYIHREMNDGDPEFHKLPDTRGLVSQYLLTLSSDEISRYVLSGGVDAGAETLDAEDEFAAMESESLEEVDEFAAMDDMEISDVAEETADVGYDEINITVRHNITSSYEFKEALDEVRAYLDENLNSYFKYGITGEGILINKAADSMAAGQFQSLSILLAVVFILMSLLFTNIKAGLLSLIPNTFPIIVLLGVMGIFEIPLDTGTAMVATIAIGVALDDTIHFMSRYNVEMRIVQDPAKAVALCIRSEIKPVLCTSLALAAGFMMLTSSSFVPIIYFALLSAMVMLLAFLGDMLITPTLLSSTQLVTLIDMLGLNLHKEVIHNSPLFSNMSVSQIKKVVLLGKVSECEKGDVPVKQGDHGDSMYLILEGNAEVMVTNNDKKEVSVAHLEPGQIFGELSLVKPGPRIAAVKANGDLKYLVINADELARIQKVAPKIGCRLMHNISVILGKRLAEVTKRM